MSIPCPPKVLISEVGPRDGLQSIKAVMPTAAKLRWISALAAAGLKEIEVGSFVPPKLLPQMADIARSCAHALTIPGPHRGGARAQSARFRERVRSRRPQGDLAGIGDQRAFDGEHPQDDRADDRRGARDRRVAQRAIPRACRLEAGMSMAFGCTIAGDVSRTK